MGTRFSSLTYYDYTHTHIYIPSLLYPHAGSPSIYHSWNSSSQFYFKIRLNTAKVEKEL